MGRNPEALRLCAQKFRDAAQRGPRRQRAYNLTRAYCLEREAGVLERELQNALPGLFDQPSLIFVRTSEAFDDSVALAFKRRRPSKVPILPDTTPGFWAQTVERLRISEAETDLSNPLPLRPLQ